MIRGDAGKHLGGTVLEEFEVRRHVSLRLSDGGGIEGRAEAVFCVLQRAPVPSVPGVIHSG